MFKQLTQPKFGRVATRFVAFVLDLFIISIIYGTIVAVITGDFKHVFSRFGVSTGNGTLDVIIGSFLFLGYFTLLQWKWNGQTVGMRAIGLKLVNEQNNLSSFNGVFIRNIIFLVTTLFSLGITIIINYLLLVFTVKQRTIHDMLSKTKIITSINK